MTEADTSAAATGSGATNDPNRLAEALRVGQQVMAQRQNSPSRFRATILGWSDGRFLIVELPRNQTISGHVSAGDELVLRYILRGVVYAFVGRVLQTMFEPSLALLEWPRGMSALPLTTERRLSVQIPATMELDSDEAGGLTFLATVTDISAGGCQVEAVTMGGPPPAMDHGARVRLRLTPSGSRREKTINAEIRSAMVSAGKVVLGMSFVDSGALDLRELADELFGGAGG